MNKTRRIRVLHLLTSPYTGGAETNLLALLRHFDRDRFEHAVAFGGSGQLESEFEREGVTLIHLSAQPLSIKSVLKIPAMVHRIREYGPDIIHSHLDIPNLYALVAARILDLRLVLHIHGLGIVPRQLLPGRGRKHWFWNRVARFYLHADMVIAICSFQLPFLARLGVKESQIAVIPNGISLGGQPVVARIGRDVYRFVSVARFFPEKDHAMLIRAFGEVSRQVPQARLTLVGDGPLRLEIERQVQGMGLQDKVDFLGIRRDIPDILAASDCFVLNSRWELHPITILEAMRAGLPVIASDVGGVADTLGDGTTGLLVQPGDQVGLSKALLSMVENPERGERMGEQGVLRVADQFSNVLVAKKIESVYAHVMGCNQ